MPDGDMPDGDTPQAPPSDRAPHDSGAPQPAPARAEPATCDYCGSDDLMWIRCKLVCRHCHQINLSCSDL